MPIRAASGKPGNTLLATRQDDEGRKQRPAGAAEIAADLKERLGQTMAATGGQPGHARGFRMEYRRADADESGAGKQHRHNG